MRPLRAIVIYLASVFLGAALLAPWIHWLLEWGAARGLPGFQKLAETPLDLLVSRILLFLALIGLWPVLRHLGIRSWREIGLSRLTGQWTSILAGLALGFGSLALIALMAIASGSRQLNTGISLAELVRNSANAGLSAIVVAVLEELLFRGALFGGLRKAFPWISAAVLSSAMYAIVHFFQRSGAPVQITWASGFETLWLMLQGFIEIERLVPGFFNLATAGLVLAAAYQRSGNLYFSIGLHGGWILWQKSYGYLTTPNPSAHALSWGNGRLTDNWVMMIVLVPVLWLVWFLPHLRKPARDAN